MARIPIIQQQTSPRGGGIVAPQPGGLETVVKAIGGVVGDITARQEQRSAENRSLWLAQKSADAQLRAQQWAIESRQSVTGLADDHPDAAAKFSDELIQSFSDEAPDEETRKALALWAPKFKAGIVSDEINWAAQRNVAYKSAVMDDTLSKYETLVTNDPSKLGSVLDEMDAFIASSGTPDYSQLEIRRKGRERLIEVAARSGMSSAVMPAAAAGIIKVSGKGSTPPPVKGVLADPALQEYARSVYKQYGIDENIAIAQLMAESGGDPKAFRREPNGVTSAGLAQFTEATAKRYGLTDRNDPRQSIKAQAAYMADLLKDFRGDYEKAIAAYNAGPGSVQKAEAAAAKSGKTWKDHFSPAMKKYTAPYLSKILSSSGYAVGGQAVTITGSTPPQIAALLPELSLEARSRIESEWDRQVKAGQSNLKNQIELGFNDDLAQMKSGLPPTNAYSVDTLAAAGFSQDKIIEYQALREIGVPASQAAKKMTVAELAALTTGDVAAGPAFEARSLAAKTYAAAADAELKSRKDDPIAHRQSVGEQLGGDLTPTITGLMSSGDVTGSASTIGRVMSARTVRAGEMATKYGYSYNPLTKSEAEATARMYKGMTSGDKVKFLGVMAASIKHPQSYSAFIEQVAGKDSADGMAGLYFYSATKSGLPSRVAVDGASYILKASEAEKTGAIQSLNLPSPKEMADDFSRRVGNSLDMADPRIRASMFNAYSAIYRGIRVDGEINDGKATDVAFAHAAGAERGKVFGHDFLVPSGKKAHDVEVMFSNQFRAATGQALLAGHRFAPTIDGGYVVVDPQRFPVLDKKTRRPVVLRVK